MKKKVQDNQCNKNLVVVRGGGDIASGIIHKLYKCGFTVLVLETHNPSAIRRYVCFSEAVYNGRHTVEDVTCVYIKNPKTAINFLNERRIAMIVDPDAQIVRRLKPYVLVDAIMAKKNVGTRIGSAPITIGVGPGFCAGIDVHKVIETKRGHDLGRVITKGNASMNTGLPGMIGGVGRERVIYAPCEGRFINIAKISDTVKKGEPIAKIETGKKLIEIYAPIHGVIRGLLREGYEVTKGFKVADIDPRITAVQNCYTISDKARCIAGGVIEAIEYNPKMEGAWQV